MLEFKLQLVLTLANRHVGVQALACRIRLHWSFAGARLMVETVGYITITIVMIFVCGAALAGTGNSPSTGILQATPQTPDTRQYRRRHVKRSYAFRARRMLDANLSAEFSKRSI
jgi:hypothetical protein